MRNPRTGYAYNAHRFPATVGAHEVRCSRGCGAVIIVALIRGEHPSTARRVCDPCAEDRAKRLAAGAEPSDISGGFARAVQRLAVELGVAFPDNDARLRAGAKARLG